jgi:hypothetical protein
MIAIINNFQVDLSKPIDINLLSNTDANPIAWYVDKPEIEPVRFERLVRCPQGCHPLISILSSIPMDGRNAH